MAWWPNTAPGPQGRQRHPPSGGHGTRRWFAQHIDVPELLPRSLPTGKTLVRSARRSGGGQTGPPWCQSRSGRSVSVAAVHSSGVQPVAINASR